ncbi:helix-turn-helix domain-containing protein, partial [Candidatus Bipolaricaulota bacterium]
NLAQRRNPQLIDCLTIVSHSAMLLVMNWDRARINNIKTRLGISRSEFARLLGVDSRTVYRWETGESSPKGSAEAVLLGIEEALKSQPDGLKDALASIGAMAAIGGLGFMIYKLIELLAGNEAGS